MEAKRFLCLFLFLVLRSFVCSSFFFNIPIGFAFVFFLPVFPGLFCLFSCIAGFLESPIMLL